MRRCRLAVVCACLLIGPSARAQEPLPAGQAQKEFDALLARVKQSDPTVDFARLRRVFSESDSYTRSRDDAEPAMRDAFVNQSVEKSLAIAREILARNYLNLEAHFVALASCLKLSDEACGNHHRYVAQGMIDSIARSGDGRSPATAWVVISVPEEYAFMLAGGFAVAGQALVEENGHSYDLLTVRNQETKEESKVYFNVDLSMAALRRMVSGPPR